LHRIIGAGERMKSLIDDLLLFSKVNFTPMEFSDVDLNEILREVINDLDVRIEQSGGSVQVDQLPIVQGIPAQFRQLFQNMIVNALKFCKKNVPPKVHVRCRRLNDDFVEVSVEDNGIGFSEKDLERVFKPFQRLHSSQEYEGSGLGLSICQKIVQRHSGKITARSQPGEGCFFYIVLPAPKATT
jgi:signal transduction histidine kinase